MPLCNIKIIWIQIDDYKTWTEKLGHDRESLIQTFQANLYSETQKMFSKYGGIVFASRYDNMLAIANNISHDQLRAIQRQLSYQNPVSLSFGVGYGETPYVAQKEASKRLLTFSSKNPEKMAFAAPSTYDISDGTVQIAHFDINDSTNLITKRLSVYESHILIQHIYDLLIPQLKKYGALVFFNGGDNFVSPSNGMIKENYEKIIDYVFKETGLFLKAGVGIDNTAKEALALANEGLQNMRQRKYEGNVNIKLGKQIQLNTIKKLR